jgi:acyl-CoA synthetase (AMP-forming)/AMP-acid ligase II
MGKLGHHKAPKSITLVDKLPQSVVGKVLRRHVRDKYWHGQQRQVG